MNNQLETMHFHHVKIGVIIMFCDKFPCRVSECLSSHPGKHGHAKKRLIGTDILTDKTYDWVITNHTIIKVPIINRQIYKLSYIDDYYMSLMDELGNSRKDIKIPNNSNYLDEIIKSVNEYGQILSIDILIVKLSKDSDQEFSRIMGYTISLN